MRRGGMEIEIKIELVKNLTKRYYIEDIVDDIYASRNLIRRTNGVFTLRPNDSR